MTSSGRNFNTVTNNASAGLPLGQSNSATTRRVTIQDLQYFIAKSDAKLKKLRASLGDYDSQDIEHHKVLKAIFSLVKKLLRLPGDDAAKEFLLAYTTRLSQADHHSAKYKMYDSSGSSGNESDVKQPPSDYFPNIHENKPSLGNPNAHKSPFTANAQNLSGGTRNEDATTGGGNTVYPVRNSHNIVIKQGGLGTSQEVAPRNVNSQMMQSHTSDMLSVRESNSGTWPPHQAHAPYQPNQPAGPSVLLGGDAFANPEHSRNKNWSKTIQDASSGANKQIQAALYNPQKSIGRQSGNSKLSVISEGLEKSKGLVHNDQVQALVKMVEQLQKQVVDNDHKVKSFEKFLNYSNPMGTVYVLKPGKSEVHMPVDFSAMKGGQVPEPIKQLHASLTPYNYSPVPFSEFHKRKFVAMRKLPNGDWYEGQWSESTGKRDGFGYCVSLEGNFLYEGYWSEGTQHGQGRIIMANGYYEGDFVTNQRHGQGKYVWNIGDYYEGEWVSSQKSGFGKLYSKAENQFYEGQFKNNRKHGQGSVISPDGTVVFRSTWKNDMKQ